MDGILTSSIFFHGITRIVICFGGIIAIYLGYRLYMFGVDTGVSKVKFDSKIVNLAASGAGPGLFLVFFGASILIVALLIGNAISEKHNEQIENKTSQPSDVFEKNQKEINDLKNFKKNDIKQE
jgi:hypothetical protein